MEKKESMPARPAASAVEARLRENPQKISGKVLNSQNGALSLFRQNYFSGTSAASSRWQFLYTYYKENSMAAPRRVCGNAPGSSAEVTSTTRSAASLCQKTSVMETTIADRLSWRTHSRSEWLNSENSRLSNGSGAGSPQKISGKVLNSQNSALSLFRQRIYRGTNAAGQRRLFLYPYSSENSMAAPCRVCGNAPGSPAIETLTTRSAAFNVKKPIVMETTVTGLSTGRTYPLKEWLRDENTFFSSVLEETITNKQMLLAGHACIAFAVLAGSVFAHASLAVPCLGWVLIALQMCRKGGVK